MKVRLQRRGAFGAGLVALLIASGCDRSSTEARPALREEGDSVVARIGDTGIRLSEVDQPIAGPLFELEYDRYLLRRESLEAQLLHAMTQRDTPLRAARILLEPPIAPLVELPGAPAALRPDRNAPVTVSVFCSFESPHCAAVQSSLADLVTLYPDSVRIAARDLPLSIHRNAGLAAEAARCAGRQGRYWTYHDLLWARGAPPAREALDAAAAAANLDRARFARCLDTHETAADVGADIALARRVGLDTVPAVLVNGRRIATPVTPDRLVWLVEAELRRGGVKQPVDAKPPTTTLPIVLRATIVGELPGLGLALIATDGSLRVVREGERVASNAILRRVGEQGAELLVDGRIAALPFGSAQAESKTERVTPEAESSVPPVLPAARGAMPVYLDREAVRERMADRVELATHLKPVPMTVDGYRLLRLDDVPAGSLYELLGLQPGDVVVAVNERAIHEGDNPLWDALDREQEVRVRVMRRGGLAHHYTYRFEE
ncbi:MAG TPA: thioredoxin domain-containing protein [Steroidobacteraceae bacterium]|nr:thioredoxin domain-containing protein [Steroidobacteraceae bacterium]